jgi:hypothetical protein
VVRNGTEVNSEEAGAEIAYAREVCIVSSNTLNITQKFVVSEFEIFDFALSSVARRIMGIFRSST